MQKGRQHVNEAKPTKDSRITVPDFTLRMQIALDLFPTCRVAADVGSDHGKLAVALLQTNACKRVIATDISAPCLAKARKAARTYKMEDRMELRVGNGLLALSENEAEVAIIAGMGGELIAQILDEGREIALPMKALLLQPMQHAARLRYYLRGHGWRIDDEAICIEGRRVFEWIRVAKGAVDNYPKGLDALEDGPNVIDEIGPLLFKRRNPIAIERLEHRQKIWQREYEMARRGMSDGASHSAATLKRRLVEAETVLRVLSANG